MANTRGVKESLINTHFQVSDISQTVGDPALLHKQQIARCFSLLTRMSIYGIIHSLLMSQERYQPDDVMSTGVRSDVVCLVTLEWRQQTVY